MLEQKTIAVISLGCDKNRVDTEKMLAELGRGSFVVTTEDDAQIIIVNTCAFIESARKEAINTILSVAELKKHKLEKLIVTGCLPQKYMAEIKDSLPEVDAFLGVASYGKILSVIEESYHGGKSAISDFSDSTDFNGRRLTTDNYAYLKIADGCDNHCTYCTIPSIRGKYKSRPLDQLITETQYLALQGVTEVILVAQDVTNYGMDLNLNTNLSSLGQPDGIFINSSNLNRKINLCTLLTELSKTDISKIRLLYCYPQLISDELIEIIKNNPKIIKYLDIPLQHIDDKILKLMGRRGDSSNIKNLITKLRREIPDIVIRTTFMVGFPGEGDGEFNNLLNFVKEYRLNNVGIFVYSKESDTPSAKLPDKATKKIAVIRQKLLAEAQLQVVKEYNQLYIGKTFRVLYEGIDYKKNLFYGRTYMSAPLIDPLIYFKADYVHAGSIVDVKVTAFNGYDLIGEKV